MSKADDDTVASTVSTLAGVGVAAEALGGTPPLVASRYEIVRWLGGGGMGRVYEVVDKELAERVALKVLKSGLSDEAIERFRREVRLTRRIQHRNVARMFDIGEHAGEKFLTMELVDGVPLGRAGRAPWPRLRALAIQICQGLAAAHEAGVIHRDLKPDNVLVERGSDRAVITDFGIARGGDESNVTQTGVVIGTPRYMPPEQLAGGELDARADIFALGVMLYELASGTRPWSGDNAIAVAVAQATEPARPLVAPDLPREAIALIEQCIAIEREQRPASAAAVEQALVALDDDAEIEHSSSRSRRGTVATMPATPVPPAQRARTETAIAVLPFRAAAADQYLADGVREDLIDTLSATSSLRVRPAGMAGAQQDADPRAVGHELGVDHVVLGSVRRIPAGLRVAAQLIGVEDGFQIWAQRADIAEAAIFTTSDELGRGIAQALSTRAAVPITRPTDPRAVDLYLRARSEMRRFWAEHAEHATVLLEEAAAISPDNAPIASALALAAVQSWIKSTEPQRLPRARAAVGRALATDHGEAFLASALLHVSLAEPAAAGADLGRALVRAPMSSQTHEWAGRFLVEIGDMAEGRRQLEIALELDPSRLQMIVPDIARLDALEGKWDAADRALQPLVRDPDQAVAQLGIMYQTRLMTWRGDVEKTIEMAHWMGTRIRKDALYLVQFAEAHLAGRPFDRATWDTMIATIYDETKPRRIPLVALQRCVETAAVIQELDAALATVRAASRFGLLDIVWFERCPLFSQYTSAAWREVGDEIRARANAVLGAFRTTSAGVH